MTEGHWRRIQLIHCVGCYDAAAASGGDGDGERVQEEVKGYKYIHFFLTVAGLRAPLSRFLEGALYKYPE